MKNSMFSLYCFSADNRHRKLIFYYEYYVFAKQCHSKTDSKVCSKAVLWQRKLMSYVFTYISKALWNNLVQRNQHFLPMTQTGVILQ